MSQLSIIIPTYCTPELELTRSIRSAAEQSLSEVEVIVIDDNSEKEEQKRCKKIVKSLSKDKFLLHSKNISYISNEGNKGLVYSRRAGVENSHGEYVTMLDSDDEFSSQDSCKIMYEATCNGKFDIVQCCTKHVRIGPYILEKNPNQYKLLESPFQGEYVEQTGNFADKFLTSGTFCLFLWGKLIKREVFIKAIQKMPLMNCFMSEDLLFSYFISRESTSYIGIPDVLYTYYLGKGISTSANMIASLDRWQKLCTPSSVFTAIMYDIQERPFTPESKIPEYMKHVLEYFIVRNIKLLQRVSPELRAQAHDELVESWGPKLIEQAEREMKENS